MKDDGLKSTRRSSAPTLVSPKLEPDGVMALRWRPSAHLRDISLLLLTALILLAPRLFLDLYYPNFDTLSNLVAGIDFARSLAEGHLLPRWSTIASFGAGQPLNLFYSPLIYYAAAAINIVVNDVWVATKIVNLLNLWAIGVVGYLALRQIGERSVALFGGVALELTPIFPSYLIKSNFMLLGGLFGFALLCVLALRERAGKGIDLAIVTCACLLALAHSLTLVVMLLSIFGAWTLLRLFADGSWRERLERLFWPGVSVLLGLGLAAFHLLPSYLDKVHLCTQCYSLQGGTTIVHQSWDREISRLAVTMILPFGSEARSTLIQWVIPLFALGGNALTALWLWHRRRWRTPAWRLALLALVASLVALALGSIVAVPLWMVFKPLLILQFGTRFVVALTIFNVLAMAAALADALHAPTTERWRQAFIGALAASALFGTAVFANYFLWHTQPTPFAGVGVERFTGNPVLRPATLRPESETYRLAGGLAAACERAGLTCEETLNTVHDRRWRITAPRPTDLVLPVAWFPSWAASINDRPADVVSDPATGLSLVRVPEGSSDVRLFWSYSRAERLGLSVSYLTAIFLIGLVVTRRLRRRAPATTVA